MDGLNALRDMDAASGGNMSFGGIIITTLFFLACYKVYDFLKENKLLSYAGYGILFWICWEIFEAYKRNPEHVITNIIGFSLWIGFFFFIGWLCDRSKDDSESN